MQTERRKHPERPVEVWAFDEHRIGLKSVLRRIWARRGERPIAVSTHKYEWIYLYGFVQPATGGAQMVGCEQRGRDQTGQANRTSEKRRSWRGSIAGQSKMARFCAALFRPRLRGKRKRAEGGCPFEPHFSPGGTPTVSERQISAYGGKIGSVPPLWTNWINQEDRLPF